VFIVASVGTEPFKQILAECEGSAGDSQASESQGQDVTGSVADSTGASGFTPTSFGGYGSGVGTLRANGGDLGGGSETLVTEVARMRGFGDYEMDQTASALKARDYKDVTDIVVRQES
jgi:DNA (cytosine-5)-methyltransferase 1